jgi:flagellar protein FliS
MLNPYDEYKKQTVMTMTPGEMINKLYDECLANLQLSIMYLDERKFEERFASLKKARQILSYLRDILNLDYEISHQLFALYEYYMTEILHANNSKDNKKVEEIIEMLTQLRDSFREAEKTSRGGVQGAVAVGK